MKITKRRSGEVLVLAFEGKMAIGADDMRVRESIREALEAGERKIVVDLKKVTMLDSSGVGELVSSYTSMVKRGGKLKLAGLGTRTLEALSVTHLTQIFEIFDDEDEAVLSFG